MESHQRNSQNTTVRIGAQTNVPLNHSRELLSDSEDRSQVETPTTSNSAPGQPNTEATASTYDDISASIGTDLQSGSFEIPSFKGADGAGTATHNRVTYQFPPALLETEYRSKHRERFDRSTLLPHSNLSLCDQINEYVKIWAVWATEIPDSQKREEVLDRVFDVLTKAWFEAARLGHRPSGYEAEPTAPQTSTKRLANRGEELPAGLRGRPRPKRDTSPSKMAVLIAISHKNGSAWAITAGELEEAAISEKRIQRRAANKDSLKAGEELLDEILNDYNGQITPQDWFDIEERTKSNPMGRDLTIYCVYEVLKSRASIGQLWGYYEKHKTAKQKENTQKRINEEQERQDLFMALALELNEDPESSKASSTCISPASREGSVSKPHTTTAVQLNQLEALIHLIEIILKETNVAYMVSIFELHEITEDDTVTDVLVEDLSSSFDRCKHILRDMLFCARQWPMISWNAEVAVDLDTNVDMCSRIQDLELQISKKKELLQSFLPSLITERDAAKDIVERDDAAVYMPARAAVPSDDNLLMTDPTATALSASAKRPLNVEESDTCEVQAPPVKKQKTGDQEGSPQIEVLTPSIKQVDNGVGGIHKRPLAGVSIEAPNPSKSYMTNEAPHRSLQVALRVKSPFDPIHFTSEKVFHQQGFTYRYTRESTLAQRRSMTEVLDKYVQYWMQERVGFNSFWRCGKYQVLAHHDDPERETVIHGIWDLQNGDQPAGFEWFYKGDGIYPSEQQEATLSETEVEEEPSVTHLPQKRSVVNPKLKDANRLRQGKLGLTAANANSNQASGSQSQRNDTSISIIKNSGNKGKPKTVRFTVKPPVIPQTSFIDTISGSRPKRHNAARKSYAEELDDEDDDDYVPSD